MYRRRRLVAAIILLVLIGLLVAGGFFIASLFGSGTTEGQAQAGTDKAAVQGQKSETGSGGQGESAGKDKAGKDKETGNDAGGSGDNAQAGGGNADTQEAEGSKDSDAADAKQEAKESGGPEETADEEPSPEATGPSSCEDSDVVLEASTDQTAYPQDKNPVLTMSVSNESDEKCTINLGTSQMEFLITSGEDRIFSSTDCQVDAVDNKQTLKSGETEKAKLTWKRNRTAPDCAPVESKPLPGTYTLVTKLGDRTSEETTFRLE